MHKYRPLIHFQRCTTDEHGPTFNTMEEATAYLRGVEDYCEWNITSTEVVKEDA